MRRPHRNVALLAAALLTTSVAVGASGGGATAAPSDPATTTTLRPNGPLPPSTATAAQAALAHENLLRMRDRIAAAQPAPAPGPAKAAPAATAPTGAGGHSSTASLLIRRNNGNTVASSTGSTLTEPAAANRGNSVYYAGNGPFASSSTDLGATWTGTGIPGGPADAPIACCDQDAVRAHSRDRLFTSLIYINNGNAPTNGVVRIFVRVAPEAAPLCSFDIDPGGTANNIVPDFPHIGLTANFLYLTLNNALNGVTWVGAQVWRLDLAQLSACVPTNFTVFTHVGSVGQRVITPVEGAQNTTTMYFGAIEAANSFRIFSWPESAGAPSQVVRTTNSTAFGGVDCRGGVGNFDFMSPVTAQGFEMRGAVHGGRVTWFWNAAPDASHPQAFVRSASFRTSDLVLLEQPDIFNAALCFGFPVVTGNVFGDLGISIAAGGQAGGGGSAAQGFVGVDDTPGDAIFFGTVILTAGGTNNRSDGRFGDYFTIRTNARCQNTYVATNYSLNGGSGTANVNARYVEFGSTLDSSCF